MNPEDTHGCYPRRGGHQVECWIDDIPFFTHLRETMASARRSVWMAVSFLNRDFRFPDGASWWDALDELAARGLDVRILYWRNPGFFLSRNLFQGDAHDLAFLRARNANWAARWDSSRDVDHCHHQKIWLVDPGEPDGVAYVGGMVMTQTDLHERARRGIPERRHDVTLGLRGPAVADVAHNFVQRWNSPGRDDAGPAPWPDAMRGGVLPWPDALPPPRGVTEVQALRTTRAGLYGRDPAPVGAREYPFELGEDAILRAYRAALRGARRTILLENQHPGEGSLLAEIDAALTRGVRVLMVVPGDPMAAIWRARAEAEARASRGETTRYSETFARLSALARHPGFVLASLVRPRAGGGLEEVYTHAKVCVVDGEWATCGSANLVDLSLTRDHTEMNLAVWDAGFASEMLRALLRGCLVEPPGDSEDVVAWIDAAHAEAIANAALRKAGRLIGSGRRLCALDPRRYALGDAESAVR